MTELCPRWKAERGREQGRNQILQQSHQRADS